MLTNGELSIMRDTIEQLMPDTCNILNAATATPDGMGGQTITWGTAGTSIACRLDVAGGQEPVVGGAVQAFSTYTLSLPYGTSIDTDNRVEINGALYAVQSVNTGQSWQAVVRCALEAL